MRRMLLVIALPALLAGACGGAVPEPQELTAQPLADAPERQQPDAASAPEETPEADGDVLAEDLDTPEGGVDAHDAADGDPVGPRPSDATAYLAEHLPDDARDHDVLLVDLDATVTALVVAYVSADGVASVEHARWAEDAFVRHDRVEAGPAEVLGTLQTPRLPVDGRAVVLGLRDEGQLRVAVWVLDDEGLAVPAACPVDAPRTIQGQNAGGVDVACDRDGDADVLVWRDGVFLPPAGESVRAGPTGRDDADGAEEGQADERGRDGPAGDGARSGRPAGDARDGRGPDAARDDPPAELGEG